MITVIFLFTGCALVTVNPDKEKQLVVAEVNGQKILKADYLKQYNVYVSAVAQQYGIDRTELETNKDNTDMLSQIKEDVVDGLINQKLIEQQAAKNNVTLTDDDKKQAKDNIQQLKDLYGQDGFAELLKQEEITESDLEQMILDNILQQKLTDKLTADVTVTDDEIKKYYEDNKATLFTDPEKVKVSHILISIPQDKYSASDQEKEAEYAKIKPKAEQVLAMAKKGDDFTKLVEQYSDDTGTKDQGGELTFSRNDPLESSFIDASFALKNPGDISDLVKTSYGYHIIKLEEKIPAKTYTLEEKKDEIKDTLLQQKKSDKMSSLMDGWKKESNIKKYSRNYK